MMSNLILNGRMLRALTCLLVSSTCNAMSAPPTFAQASDAPRSADSSAPSVDPLSPDQWERIDDAVERGLAWLARQQQRDGSFPTLPTGQPGITGLGLMAFMAHGHLPGEGPYGKSSEKAVKFIIAQQKPNGLLAMVAPRGAEISRNVSHDVGNTAVYNHAIAALALSEAYAAAGGDVEQTRAVIESALRATLQMQKWPRDMPIDQGGWRYLHRWDHRGSDLSITGWQLMFLRSAKNAGFEVPQQSIDDAIGYVRQCFRPKFGTFLLFARDNAAQQSRGMAGAGILALAHAGLHNTAEARQAGDWLLQHDFNDYNTRMPWSPDRYHYGVFHSCQAMYQLGGHYWTEFFPPVVRVLLENQRPDGSWAREVHQGDGKFGNAYTTALMILTLGAPNQLLPVFQR